MRTCIDFDAAHKAWMINKKVFKSQYKYICIAHTLKG